MNKKKLPPEITIKVRFKVDRELYNRIVKFGKDNGVAGTIEDAIKKQAEEWFPYMDALIHEAEMQEKSKDIVVPASKILGADGQPIGRA